MPKADLDAVGHLQGKANLQQNVIILLKKKKSPPERSD